MSVDGVTSNAPVPVTVSVADIVRAVVLFVVSVKTIVEL